MNTRILAWIAIAASSIILLCGGAVTALFSGPGIGGGTAATTCYLPTTTTSSTPDGSAAAASTSPASPGTVPAVKGWSTEQVTNAAHIVSVGQRLSVPRRGWIIAVATAIQESTLRSLSGGDRDSVGLFQQRPSQGWGTPGQLQDPLYASTKFYRALLVVPGWQSMALTDAAQIVQRSAYPDAYADHAPAATALVDAVGSGNSWALPENLDQCLSNCPVVVRTTQVDQRSIEPAPPRRESVTGSGSGGSLTISPSSDARITRNGQESALSSAHQFAEPANAVAGAGAGSDQGGCFAVGPWTQPINAPVGSGFRTVARPGHDGVDLSAARGAAIRAASAGTVIRVRCNAVHADTGAPWGCDRDGDPELTRGCGWYVDIAHAGRIITRYCHMGRPPLVAVGATVAAGQVIGEVGSTGHSSGPHLHFEVHVNNDQSASGVIDPIPFMARNGAPLSRGQL